MTFQCEDVRDFGLILVPNTSPEYGGLLADIQRRIDSPHPELAGMPEFVRKGLAGSISPDKLSTSAILRNESGKSIAALALIWYYEEVSGRTYTRSSGHDFGRSLLLPFNVPQAFQAVRGYWSVVLPGSKRYLAEDGIAGDNTDVRLPVPEEIWRGGGGFGRVGGGSAPSGPVKKVRLVIDGVFFVDGGFAGANSYGLWEQITSEAFAHAEVATTAKDGRNRGVSAAAILEEIETITGPATTIARVRHFPRHLRPGSMTPEKAQEMKQFHLEQRANEIERQRQGIGDSATIEWLAAQASIRLPEFHKL